MTLSPGQTLVMNQAVKMFEKQTEKILSKVENNIYL